MIRQQFVLLLPSFSSTPLSYVAIFNDCVACLLLTEHHLSLSYVQQVAYSTGTAQLLTFNPHKKSI